MGRCYEFGISIERSCDHAMIAGEESCGCSVCGTVCTGKFRGCAEVWARGPQMVELRHPPAAGARPLVLASEERSASPFDNGAAGDTPSADERSDLTTRLALATIVSKVDVVMSELERLRQVQPSLPDATLARLGPALERLPGEIAEALTPALTAVRRDLRSLDERLAGLRDALELWAQWLETLVGVSGDDAPVDQLVAGQPAAGQPAATEPAAEPAAAPPVSGHAPGADADDWQRVLGEVRAPAPGLEAPAPADSPSETERGAS